MIWTVPPDYRTPATAYPLTRNPGARLVRAPYTPGGYDCSGGPRQGIRHYVLAADLPVTSLQIKQGGRWRTWMVDDPLHWDTIQHLAARFRPGLALIGGLGLGLIVHALQPFAHRLTHLTIVERERHVIDLIRPHLPAGIPYTVVEADFWSVAAASPAGRFATIFVDLWVGGVAEVAPAMLEARAALEARHPWPQVQSFWFGIQRRVDFFRAIRRAADLAFRGVDVAGLLAAHAEAFKREGRLLNRRYLANVHREGARRVLTSAVRNMGRGAPREVRDLDLGAGAAHAGTRLVRGFNLLDPDEHAGPRHRQPLAAVPDDWVTGGWVLDEPDFDGTRRTYKHRVSARRRRPSPPTPNGGPP